MNYTQPAWSPADISSVINMCVSFLVLLLNMHQSYSHRHFQSECFGESCCGIESINRAMTPREDKSMPTIVISPPAGR